MSGRVSAYVFRAELRSCEQGATVKAETQICAVLLGAGVGKCKLVVIHKTQVYESAPQPDEGMGTADPERPSGPEA